MQVQPGGVQLGARSDAAGEHPGLFMPAQVDLAHPSLARLGHAERGALVGAQGLPGLVQGNHTEGAIGQLGQAAGQ